MEAWIGILAGAGSGLLGGGIAWGVLVTRVGRLERDIERLEKEKASKEAHDGTHAQLRDLRADIDKRFDRLERLILARGATDPGA